MKNVLTLSFVALATTVFAGDQTYRVNFPQDTVVAGKSLKAGQYKVSIDGGNATLKQGKESIQVPAHEEAATRKADSNVLVYGEGQNLKEIRLGGTQTKIVFGDPAPAKSGM
jgi:hypothetical protein